MSAKQSAREKERRRWERFYGPLYLPQIGADFSKCVYCGWPKESIDHCPPLRWVYAMGSQYFKDKCIQFLLVPSCQECNRLLGDNKLFTLAERAEYLFKKFGKRYKRFRDSVLWSQEEVDELTGNVKTVVDAFATMQVAIDRRMENALALRVSEEDSRAETPPETGGE